MKRIFIMLFLYFLAYSSNAMSNEEFSKKMIDSKLYFEKMSYGDYTSPIKVSDKDSFLYVYGLLLEYEINSPIPQAAQDRLVQYRNKCLTIGRMLTTKDFLILNREFATKDQIERYESDPMLNSYKKDVGSNCKSILELNK